MLRDVPDLRPGPASRPARALTLAALGGAALLVSGLRGPAERAVSAQETKKAKPALAVAAPASAVDPMDYVPGETGVVVDIRPSRLLAAPEAAEFLASLGGPGQNPTEAVERMFGLKPAEVERVVAVLFENTARESFGGLPFSFIVVANRGHDWQAAARNFIPDFVSAQFAGRTYWRSATGVGRPVICPIDDRTAIFGSEAAVQAALGAARRPGHGHNWDDAWVKVADGLIQVAADGNWVARRAEPMLASPQGATLRTFAPLWTRGISHAASLNDAPGLTFDAAIVCDQGGTEQVADTVRALLTLARNAFEEIGAEEGAAVEVLGSPIALLAGVIKPILASADVTVEQNVVRLHAGTELTMADVTKALAPAITASRIAAGRSQSINNLKQIALAMHNYHDAYGKFPSAVMMGPDGKTPHSWRVAILPYIEQSSIYQAYNFDEPWDGPNNRKLLEQMPAIYRAGGVGGAASNPTHASYFAIAGPGTMLGEKGSRMADITDGTSNTIMVVEAKREIPWTSPEDIVIDPNLPLPKLGGFFDDGFDAAFGDGSVRFLRNSISEPILRALFSRNGGEVIPSDAL